MEGNINFKESKDWEYKRNVDWEIVIGEKMMYRIEKNFGRSWM